MPRNGDTEEQQLFDKILLIGMKWAAEGEKAGENINKEWFKSFKEMEKKLIIKFKQGILLYKPGVFKHHQLKILIFFIVRFSPSAWLPNGCPLPKYRLRIYFSLL